MLKISVAAKPSSKESFVVVPLLEEHSKKNPYPAAYKKLIDDLVKSKDFKNAEGESCYVISREKNLPARLVLMGVVTGA